MGPGEPEKLAQACPKHLPAALGATRGPCMEIRTQQQDWGVLLEPAHDPSALPGARQRGAEGSFALCTAQLGLQLLGEASSVF